MASSKTACPPRNLCRTVFWVSISLLAVAASVSCHAASVGPAGYFADFSSLPAVVDWSTTPIAGATGDVTTPAGLDAAVQTVTSGSVSSELLADAGDPPAFKGSATWSSSGQYVQTRPTAVRATLLLCTLVNGLGVDAVGAKISYDFRKVAIVAEEVDGQRAFYSLSGAAGSWVLIPEFCSANPGTLAASLSFTWPTGSTLYLLWADDNGSPSPDTACQIDNFSITAVPGTQVPVAITGQPQDQQVNELQPVTFVAGATGFPAPALQWYTNGIAIPGATNALYSLPATPFTYDGLQFQMVAQNTVSNQTYTATSRTATLTVISDTNPPVLTGAQPLGLTQVQVSFSERVTPASATNLSNYVMSGTNGTVTILNAALDSSQTNVILAVAPLTDGAFYTLTVNNVADQSHLGNPIAANSQTQFLGASFALAGIGNPVPQGGFSAAGNGWNIWGGGSDIGGTNDQFQFNYQQRTGDFDLMVRLDSLTLADAWSEAGLLAREELAAGARSASAVATPSISGCYFQSRSATNGATTLTGSFPVNYPNTWLRLKRVGSVFSGYAGFDGRNWTQLGTATLAMGPTIYLGFAVCSRNPGQLATAAFRDFGTVTSAGVNGPLTFESLGQCSRRTALVISEIMYHPARFLIGTNEAKTEFIELFNSRGEPEDISGYRLTGAVDYTFPTNTVIPGGGFLVVARSPSDMTARYGVTGVLGPWVGAETNGLPNDGGTIRLRHRTGAIFLEINYSDHSPWPVAADGAGHSLVLARPSLGADDPRAWAASDVIGGSPGQWNPVSADPLDGVVINEFLAHTDPPLEDYIELYNHSSESKELSGAWLSDEAGTNKFRVPLGTLLPPHGFTYFTASALGFNLNSAGEQIFLVNSNRTRVIDALAFGPQQNSVAYGRMPDGASAFYRLTAPTPGTNNAPPLLAPVVINEIMYNPVYSQDDDQYVELYNRSNNVVDLSNWRFTSGIDYIFPPHTLLQSHGYLVVARNAERMRTNYPNLSPANCLGNFGGKLSHAGERLALAMPHADVVTNATGLATNIMYIEVNEVTYRDGGRWPQWADGGGSSLELINPDADNRLAANWADSDETRKAPWGSFFFRGRVDNGSVSADQLQVLAQGAGEFLIDDVQVLNASGVNQIANSSFESNSTGWTAEGTEAASGWESTEGYASSRCYHVRALDRGDNTVNRVRTPLMASLAANSTATIGAKIRWLRGHPEALFRIRGNWLEAVGRMALPANLGTPGLPNSRSLTNAPPAIFDVQHSPALPAANEPIAVTARVSDSTGVASLNVKYRLDPSSTYNTVAMRDDGQGSDVIPGDGIYTALIPGQPAGTMVAFYLQAADQATPAATATFPNDAPARECLVRAGDPMLTGNYPVYRVWMTQNTFNTWSSRSKLDNRVNDVTIVLGNQRVIYNAQGRFAGSPYIAPSYNTPSGARCGYKFDLPADDLLLGSDALVFDFAGGHGGTENTEIQEQMAYWIADLLNMPFSFRYCTRLIVNGVTDMQRGGMADAILKPDGEYLGTFWPNDETDLFFRVDRGYEFSDGGGLTADPMPTLQVFTTPDIQNGTTALVKKTARYRWNWNERSFVSNNDYTNFFALVDAVNSASPEPYTSATEALADVDEWMRFFAFNHIINGFDSYGHVIGKNSYAFRPVGGKWHLIPFDLDWLMLVSIGYGYTASNGSLWDCNDPVITRMYNHPPFRRNYLRIVQEAVDGPLQAGVCNPLMDAKYKQLVANGITMSDGVSLVNPSALKTWFSQRRTYLVTQLSAVAANFAVSGGQNFTVSSNLVTLTGTAPLAVEKIAINGIFWPLVWTSVNSWSLTLPVSPGQNNLTILGYDPRNSPVPGASNLVTVVYNGTVPSPLNDVVLNEIMCNPRFPDAQYVELFNASSTTAFDLSGWNLRGLNYTFSPGTFISPGAYLVLTKDRIAFDTAYGPSLKVFDEFPGALQLDGETISLIKPGSTTVPDVVIDRVRYEGSAPWPLSPTGTSLQLIDPAQDRSRVGNWGSGQSNPVPQPQWVYAWTNLTATSSRLVIYLLSAGEIYVDDVKLVAGTMPERGGNLVQGGDFEAPLGPTWNFTGNFTGSSVSSSFSHTGSNSLHIIATGAGSGSDNGIYQDISPALTIGATYTVSFWCRQSTNGGPLVVQLSGANTTPIFDPTPALPMAAATATPGVANSISASLPAFPTLWLNELQAENLTGPQDNFGEQEPWLELYNPGSNSVGLAGLYLGTNYSSPTLWAFPPDASVGAGQFLVIWADGQPEQTSNSVLHTNFRLTPGSGSLALSRFVGNSLQIVDYLTYTGLPVNYSYGDVPDAQPFYREPMYRATPGGTNNAALPPISVSINEWLAENTGYFFNPATGKYDDWFELYNPASNSAELGGYYLTDTLTNRFEYQIPTGFTVPPRGFLLVWADDATFANTNLAELHVPFKLSKGGEAIGLFAPDGTAIDAVTFGPQTSNISEGRYPDGGALRLFMETPSPGAPNILPPAAAPPSLSSFEMNSDGSVSLRFQAALGHTYRLEFKNALTLSTWTPLGPDVFATLTELTVNDPNPSPSHRFYRVVQLN